MTDAEQRPVSDKLIELTKDILEQQRHHAESARTRAMTIFSAASILLVVLPTILKSLIDDRQLVPLLGSPSEWTWPVSLTPIFLTVAIISYLGVGAQCYMAYKPRDLDLTIRPKLLLEHYRDIDTNEGKEHFLLNLDGVYSSNFAVIDSQFNHITSALRLLGLETIALVLALTASFF